MNPTPIFAPAPGRPLSRIAQFAFLALAIGLLAAGAAALVLAVAGRFLPHDERFLGLTASQLCESHGCRVVHFMVHDRAAFGGVVLAIGLLYAWLATVPLRQRRAWAWWALFLSGVAGFAGFLAYLGYGYLDTWHGAATLALLPCFAVGLFGAWSGLVRPRGIGCLREPGARLPQSFVYTIGRGCLLAAALGSIGAGLTILTVGMTAVFVPQDLAYLGVEVHELHALNPRLVSLIAHDRAGFGGALVSCGVALVPCIWCGQPSRLLWWILTLAGLAGWAPAIGVHFAIGYTDPVHLAPAVAGAALYGMGLTLTYRSMVRGQSEKARTELLRSSSAWRNNGAP